jgi:hypothetical protein
MLATERTRNDLIDVHERWVDCSVHRGARHLGDVERLNRCQCRVGDDMPVSVRRDRRESEREPWHWVQPVASALSPRRRAHDTAQAS